MAPSKKVDVSKIDAEKVAQDAMDEGDLGPEAEILGTRVESTGDVIVVTSAGVKARVTTDGEVQHLVGPQAAPDIYEPPEFSLPDDDVAPGAEDLPPLEEVQTGDEDDDDQDDDEPKSRSAELDELKVDELKEIAAELGVEGTSTLKKAGLVEAIVAAEASAAGEDDD